MLSVLVVSLIFFSCIKEVVDPSVEPEEQEIPSLDLLQHFGQLTTPEHADSICQFTPYLGDFDDNAIAIGQKVNDFTLYDNLGNAINLEDKLLEGKPVFLMTDSCT